MFVGLGMTADGIRAVKRDRLSYEGLSLFTGNAVAFIIL
jgi:hypothetical protein